MILLYALLAFVFLVGWVRGIFWAGAFMSSCGSGLAVLSLLLGYAVTSRNEHFDLIGTATYGNMPVLWIIGAIGMVPWCLRTLIQRDREERLREALHGISLNSRR